MLMPHLTVTASAAAAHTATKPEHALAKQPDLAPHSRLQGNRPDAVLKILEALNRHLIGSEPHPKEALVRLLETLSKILKFPPLPQESLRDFTKRLVVHLETLSPAARFALEKQLGQRNLAITIRILADAVKGINFIEAPRLSSRSLPLILIARPETRPAENTPATARPVPGQLPIPVRPFSGQQPLQAASLTPAQVPLLQAALKVAFSQDGDIASSPGDSTADPAAVPATANLRTAEIRPVNATLQAGTDRTTESTSTRFLGNMEAEPIPLLKAAVAFLAADAEARSLVSEIASGHIDSQLMAEIEQELGLEPAPAAEGAMGHERQEEPAIRDQPSRSTNQTRAEPQAQKAAVTADVPAQPALRREALGAGERFHTTLPATETKQQSVQPVPPTIVAREPEVDGFKAYQLGEWELEMDAETFAAPSQTDTHSGPARDPLLSQQQRGPLPDTGENVAEAVLSPQEGIPEPQNTEMLEGMPAEAADMDAETVFAQIAAGDETTALPETGNETVREQARPAPENHSDRATLAKEPEVEPDANPPLRKSASGPQTMPARLPATNAGTDTLFVPLSGEDNQTLPAKPSILTSNEREQPQRAGRDAWRAILNTVPDWAEKRSPLQRDTSEPQPRPGVAVGRKGSDPMFPLLTAQQKAPVLPNPSILSNGNGERAGNPGRAVRQDLLETVPDLSAKRSPLQKSVSEPLPRPLLDMPVARKGSEPLPLQSTAKQEASVPSNSSNPKDGKEERWQSTDLERKDSESLSGVARDMRESQPLQKGASELPQQASSTALAANREKTPPAQPGSQEKPLLSPDPPLPTDDAGEQAQWTDLDSNDWRDLLKTVKEQAEGGLPLPKNLAEPLAAAFRPPVAGDDTMGLSSMPIAESDPPKLPVLPGPASNAGDEAHPMEMESRDWALLLGTLEERPNHEPTLSRPALTLEVLAAPLLSQPNDGGLRTVVPFIMIPYLPAMSDVADDMETEEADQTLSGQDEEPADGEEDAGEGDDKTASADATEEAIDRADQDETADAYDLYRHMGGLG